MKEAKIRTYYAGAKWMGDRQLCWTGKQIIAKYRGRIPINFAELEIVDELGKKYDGQI